MFVAATPAGEPEEQRSADGFNWTRKSLAEWLVQRLCGPERVVVGIRPRLFVPACGYFERHGIDRQWPTFLDDFCARWPTDADGVWVRDIREGRIGAGASRSGEVSWFRQTELAARGSKPVFRFDVEGQVAASTHAGLPWLRFIRQRCPKVHFWPFDGWDVPLGSSVIAEVYPSLWRAAYPRQTQFSVHQHDAYVVACWLRDADRGGELLRHLRSLQQDSPPWQRLRDGFFRRPLQGEADAMLVPVSVQLGLAGRTRHVGDLRLDTASVHATSTWSGSIFHVLEMGRHYEDYVLSPREIRLPNLDTIPSTYPYERLATKIKTTGVTGNIGEAVAAIFARRVLGAPLSAISHVRPKRSFRRRKAPDYLMKIGPLITPAIGWALNAAGPVWRPRVVASRIQGQVDSGKHKKRQAREALEQLAACWTIVMNRQPETVGYGLIVTFAYAPPREVRASFIAPKNQDKLLTILRAGTPTASDLEGCLHA